MQQPASLLFIMRPRFWDCLWLAVVFIASYHNHRHDVGVGAPHFGYEYADRWLHDPFFLHSQRTDHLRSLHPRSTRQRWKQGCSSKFSSLSKTETSWNAHKKYNTVSVYIQSYLIPRHLLFLFLKSREFLIHYLRIEQMHNDNVVALFGGPLLDFPCCGAAIWICWWRCVFGGTIVCVCVVELDLKTSLLHSSHFSFWNLTIFCLAWSWIFSFRRSFCVWCDWIHFCPQTRWRVDDVCRGETGRSLCTRKSRHRYYTQRSESIYVKPSL